MNSQPQPQLPEGERHLLLPRAHVHLFFQIVTVVLGVASFIGGLLIYIFSINKSIADFEGQTTFSAETAQVVAFLSAGILMGLGISLLVGWVMWKFITRFRVRFTITLIISVISITAGLLSVAIQSDPRALEFTFYFFTITLGVFSGLLSLWYFFRGLARHIFRTHKHPLA